MISCSRKYILSMYIQENWTNICKFYNATPQTTKSYLPCNGPLSNRYKMERKCEYLRWARKANTDKSQTGSTTRRGRVRWVQRPSQYWILYTAHECLPESKDQEVEMRTQAAVLRVYIHIQESISNTMSKQRNLRERYGMPESALTNACQDLWLSGAGLRGVIYADYCAPF